MVRMKFIQKFHMILNRYKSGSSSSNKDAIIRFHYENKYLYGELVKSDKNKRIRKKQNNVEKKLVEQNPSVVANPKKSVENVKPDDNLRVNKSADTPTDVGGKAIDDEPALHFPVFTQNKEIYSKKYTSDFDSLTNFTEHNYFPSVTTILSSTLSDSALNALKRWKNNLIAELGEEGFARYSKNLLQSGANLHKCIFHHFTGVKFDILPELDGCWKSLEPVFPLLENVKVLEKPVVHKDLQYKGIVDCVAEFRGKPVLIDWKKTDKIKTSISMTYDAPLQVAAYVGAVNFDDCYPFKVEEALIVMSYVDGTKADIFYLNKKNVSKYWNLWLRRLKEYTDKSLKVSY